MEEEIRKVFADLGVTEIEQEHGRFVVTVVAEQFERMDEGERQHVVWKRALDQLGSQASTGIEFIFTYSPSEKEKLDRGEGLEELQE